MSQALASLWRVPEVSLTPAHIAQITHTLEQRLRRIDEQHADARLSTSLAAEDMVLTDALARVAPRIRLFTLATGRLHQETIDMVQTVQNHYGLVIHQVAPDPLAVADMVTTHGLNGFYDSETARQACCQVRKVQPLAKALEGATAWVTGMRREQSVTRAQVDFEAVDDAHQLVKFNPLFDWREDEVWAYLAHHRVPVHPLHHTGYPSIGCEPCTRAIRAGEDVRAGRWWWLHQTHKECGLHVK